MLVAAPAVVCSRRRHSALRSARLLQAGEDQNQTVGALEILERLADDGASGSVPVRHSHGSRRFR